MQLARVRKWVLSLGTLSAVFWIAGGWPIDQQIALSPPGNVSNSYLDRSRIDRQSVRSKKLIDTILMPVIGFPARIEAERRIRVVLSKQPKRDWKFLLIERNRLASIDQFLYAVAPAANAREILLSRLAQAKAERADRAASIRTRHAPRASAGLDRMCEIAAEEDLRAIEERITTLRAEVERVAQRSAAVERLAWDLNIDRSTAPTFAIETIAPETLAPGLYTLVILDHENKLVDAQLNAVYRPRDGESKKMNFIVASDLQWGRKRAVAGSILEWVSLMNGLAAAKDEAVIPEFIALAGDIVDGQFGSAASVTGQLFGGGADYPRDFLQVWLALAALRIPAYILPGNHDGYRFTGFLGDTMADGLLLFESTFGPQFFSFDRGELRFIFVNSYDLPGEYRTSRRSTSSTIFENVSDKLNVLNWGGGIQTQQYQWLRGQLELPADSAAPPAAKNKTLFLFMHHDPRGSYPVVKRTTLEPDEVWSTKRHFPVTGDRADRGISFATVGPHFADTVAVHAGFYTPLRQPSSPIRSKEWFELGLSPVPPATLGFPGWLRYEQIWHSELVYSGRLDDATAFDVEDSMVPPGTLLTAIRDARVRAMFVAHNNRFCLEEMKAEESIFGRKAAAELAAFGNERSRTVLERTTLLAPLDVYHVADVADFESEGHGFFWVEADGPNLVPYEIDHL